MYYYNPIYIFIQLNYISIRLKYVENIVYKTFNSLIMSMKKYEVDSQELQ